jgi:dihydropteroate synthase
VERFKNTDGSGQGYGLPVASTMTVRGQILDLSRPVVMGILNITPDSFYAGSRMANLDAMLEQAEQMLEEGAAILDIGGASTRPGAEEISVEEEVRRVVPAVEKLSKKFPQAILSIDTYQSRVARAAVEAGAAIVNDVSGGTWDMAMIDTVSALRVPYIAMHAKEKPATMQAAPHYDDVVVDVFDHLRMVLQRCNAAGVHDVILDPGFGFAKNSAHNFSLLKNLESLRALGRPLLVGVSRKGMVHRTLGISPDEALNGSTVLHTIALMKGASVLRVHDVKEAIEVLRLVEAVGTAL